MHRALGVVERRACHDGIEKLSKFPLQHQHSLEKDRAPCKRSNALCTHGIDYLPDPWLQPATAACKRAYRKGADRDENGRPVGTELDPA